MFKAVPADGFAALMSIRPFMAGRRCSVASVHTTALPQPPLPHAPRSAARLLPAPRQLPAQVPRRSRAALPLQGLRQELLATDLPSRLPRPQAILQRAAVPAARERRRPPPGGPQPRPRRPLRAAQVPQARPWPAPAQPQPARPSACPQVLPARRSRDLRAPLHLSRDGAGADREEEPRGDRHRRGADPAPAATRQPAATVAPAPPG